jgi:hypothetical protein
MKRISFLVPVATNGTVVHETRQGFRVWLDIDGFKHPFVLQLGLSRPHILTDFASGFQLANLSGLMLESFVRHPAAHRERLCDWRRVAQDWLDDACARIGTGTVRAKLASVPVLNS